MTDISSYVTYLPPVLWSHDRDPAQFLGRLLCGFEKILTGIDDSIPFAAEPFEKTIDAIPRLFDPRTTDERFLNWLAAWVGLELRGDWSAYQQRKLIAEMVSIYQRHGSKDGLYTYLDMYALIPERPRIAIDEGEALFRLTFLTDKAISAQTFGRKKPALPRYIELDAAHRRIDRTAALRVLAYSFVAGYGTADCTGVLLHPTAIAVDGKYYIVSDMGGGDTDPFYPVALWRVTRTGSIDYVSGMGAPLPKPFYCDPGNLCHPQALLLDDKKRQCYVLDSGAAVNSPKASLHILDITQVPAKKLAVIDLSAKVTYPVDMVRDSKGKLIVLDRGGVPAGYPPEGSVDPRLVVVDVMAAPSKWQTHALKDVIEPTAVVMDMTGQKEKKERFLVADAGNQYKSEPAELFRIDPEQSGWTATPLLKDVPQKENPLIFPSGMAWTSPDRLYVCDTGLRWGWGQDQANKHQTYRTKAEPAAVYCVDVSLQPPTITKVTHERRLVNPGKMAIDPGGDLVITDTGDARRAGGANAVTRDWRARPYEFGVTVHFSQDRPTSPERRNLVRDAIQEVIEQQKPAHTVCLQES